jgi:hypothetical protein
MRKGRPVVYLKLSPIVSAADIVTALGSVAHAVAAGDLTPDEGQAVAAVLEIKRGQVAGNTGPLGELPAASSTQDVSGLCQ